MTIETVKIGMQLMGGLALFIYGMNFMSDGLQKAAGEKMKSILAMLTKNVFVGILAGTVATAILQSSGAVTVMVIGFVSAGLITLRQAISIIMGANIGTCVTAQLVAFNIGDFSWAFVIIGFIMYFFMSNHEKIKDFGQAIFAFGILFSGLNIMSAAMQPLAQSEAFAQIMLKVADVPVLGIIAGALMTTLVQSSSASIAVLQKLAATPVYAGAAHGLIGIAGAIPILFGTNIGSTTTALIASIGGTTNAKRTALSHFTFNVVGTMIFIWFTPIIADFVTMISPTGDEVDVISRQIANAHLTFNVATTIVFLPIVGLLAKFVTKMIPEKEKDIDPLKPIYLDYRVLEQPFAAIHLAIQELSRMATITSDMLSETKKAFLENNLKAAQNVMQYEEIVNALQAEITRYLSSIFYSESVTKHQAETISGLLHVVSDIEHIGDNCKNIADFSIEKIANGYQFSDIACEEINSCFVFGAEMVHDAVESLNAGDKVLARKVKTSETEMDIMEEELRLAHTRRLDEGTCSPEFTVLYNDIIHNIERIGDSCENIANVVLDNINFKRDTEMTEKEKENAMKLEAHEKQFSEMLGGDEETCGETGIKNQ